MRSTQVISSSRLLQGAFLGALLLSSACKSTTFEPKAETPKPAAPQAAAQQPAASVGPMHASISNQVSSKAQVTAIDAAARLVTLRREDGSLLQVKAGDAVRNFAQIEVGDTLLVEYKETLEATRCAPGEPAMKTEGAIVAGRAEAGAKPAAAAGAAVSVRVKIESIDREHEIVVFSLASGELITRRIATPEGREFVKGLKIGDTVQLDYTVALAMGLKKL
jgi:hypothetical protein